MKLTTILSILPLPACAGPAHAQSAYWEQTNGPDDEKASSVEMNIG